jgi:hypothetical protein
VGIDTLRGAEGRNSAEDMKPSSSASQSDRTVEQRGEDSVEDVDTNNCVFGRFDFRIVFNRYIMGAS